MTVAKTFRHGTHRSCSPDETWQELEQRLPAAGITRVADITRLDRIGIPVFQAIRPSSLNLSVSQGKGLEPILAKVSAVAESIEGFSAQQPCLPTFRERLGIVREDLAYGIEELATTPNALSDSMVIDWVPAEFMGSGTKTLVPLRYITLDFRISEAWRPPTFSPNSNGLASGNCLEEAQVHALCELIERDALASADRPRLVNLDSLPADDDCWQPLYLCVTAGVDVLVWHLRACGNLPAFLCRISSSDLPMPFQGSGAHPSKSVALSRALTEAAQSRLTHISGARDDLLESDYWPNRWSRRRAQDTTDAALDWSAIPEWSNASIDEDRDQLTLEIESASSAPIWVDLTDRDIAFPVVRVISPTLRFDHHATVGRSAPRDPQSEP